MKYTKKVFIGAENTKHGSTPVGITAIVYGTPPTLAGQNLKSKIGIITARHVTNKKSLYVTCNPVNRDDD